MPEIQKRQIAYKVRIKNILEGNYIKEEGWTPNYIQLPDNQKISRVNLIATIIEKQDDSSAVLEDGTGTISVREFENTGKFANLNIGDVILLVGRPRQYATERYILPEIVKKIQDTRWITIRKLELEKQSPSILLQESPIKPADAAKSEEAKDIYEEESPNLDSPISEEEIVEDVIDNTEQDKAKDSIIDYIQKNDSGEGVELSSFLSTEEGKTHAESLLKDGEIFEVRPGRYKVLE